MAKTKPTKSAKPRKATKVPDFAADDPLVMKGIWDSILKSLFDNIAFDLKKINPDDLRVFVQLGGKIAKQIADIPFDLDDKLIDAVVQIIMNLVEGTNEDGSDDDIVMMGDHHYTKKDATAFWKKFDSPNERCCRMLEKYPQTIKTLERLTPANQEKVMASPFLLNLLVIFGPMILQWIIDRLSRD